jgi:hypothetical protein
MSPSSGFAGESCSERKCAEDEQVIALRQRTAELPSFVNELTDGMTTSDRIP